MSAVGLIVAQRKQLTIVRNNSGACRRVVFY
jgi:hypothetical protein